MLDRKGRICFWIFNLDNCTQQTLTVCILMPTKKVIVCLNLFTIKYADLEFIKSTMLKVEEQKVLILNEHSS